MNGRAEYSFVEIVMQTHEPGEVAWSTYLNQNWVLFDVELEDVTEVNKDVALAKAENISREYAALGVGAKSWTFNSKALEADLTVTQPFTVWQFNPFGQNFMEGCASGIEHEMQQMDSGYVFQNFLEELKKIGQQLIEADKAHPRNNLRPVGYDYKLVRFVTLWSYRSFEDTYNHEWDSDWTLEGLVDVKNPVLGDDEVKETRIFGLKEL